MGDISQIDDFSKLVTDSMYVQDASVLESMNQHISYRSKAVHTNTQYPGKSSFIQRVLQKTQPIIQASTFLKYTNDVSTMFMDQVKDRTLARIILERIKSHVSHDVKRSVILPPIHYVPGISFGTRNMLPKVGVYLYFENAFMTPVLDADKFKVKYLRPFLQCVYNTKVVTQSAYINIANYLRSMN